MDSSDFVSWFLQIPPNPRRAGSESSASSAFVLIPTRRHLPARHEKREQHQHRHRFKALDPLPAFLRTHTGDRPYGSSETFATSGNCTRHARTQKGE
ncbi:hypothetical protein T484DRAFT_1855488 [Baffinella frigidus]|nr:hypothetical protein T484DRAFT_1855488 [Cryptophyta sp. CCMP2293]